MSGKRRKNSCADGNRRIDTEGKDVASTRGKIKRTAAAIAICFAAFVPGACSHYAERFPDTFMVSEPGSFRLDGIISVRCDESDIPAYAGKSSGSKAELMLFDLIPIKSVTVTTGDAPMLVASGEPFGIKILSRGVMVVGVGEVACAGGACSPAAKAGLRTGDIILTVDGAEVTSNTGLQKRIAASDGSDIDFTIQRGDSNLELTLTPAYSIYDKSYQAGIWVRDSSAGIGTLTYYDPATLGFAGLGHPICDADTGEMVPLSSGEIVDVDISGVVRSSEGVPGELRGCISDEGRLGTLSSNNRCGVFGSLSQPPEYGNAIPMAFRQEVRTGKASVITTTDDGKPAEYDIMIEKINLSGNETSRSMTIRITDNELLSKTGGIVQGMSGSPIIQDGKLVGAVTHVFVSNPTRGYAIFAQTMYENAA